MAPWFPDISLENKPSSLVHRAQLGRRQVMMRLRHKRKTSVPTQLFKISCTLVYITKFQVSSASFFIDFQLLTTCRKHHVIASCFRCAVPGAGLSGGESQLRNLLPGCSGPLGLLSQKQRLGGLTTNIYSQSSGGWNVQDKGMDSVSGETLFPGSQITVSEGPGSYGWLSDPHVLEG